MRQIQVEKFSGPLDLLLQLIEQQELDISQISLATVTEQYIAELQKMTELPADELADFLVVAAKLLLIKSRLMVPGEAEEGDDTGLDLERQLKMYQAFVEASKTIGKLYNRHKVSYPREGWTMIEPIFNPPQDLKPADLRDLYAGVLHELEPITRLPQTVIIRTINIREKINQIKDRLVQEKRSSLHTLLKETGNKTEVIVTFLALLELVKQRDVVLAQDGHFNDIHIEVLETDPEKV